MRIEARYRQTRMRDAEARPHIRRDDAHGPNDEVARQQPRHVGIRNVDRDGDDRQLRRPQQHDGLRSFAVIGRRQRRKELRMARMSEAGGVKDVLGDGIGDDGACGAARNQIDALLDGGDRARSIRRVGNSGRAGDAMTGREHRQGRPENSAGVIERSDGDRRRQIQPARQIREIGDITQIGEDRSAVP